MAANEVDWTIGGMSDPLTVQAKILDRFEDVTGNAIVDPNNPASVIMEGFASLASSMVRSIEDTVRPAIYPARANTAEDLFKHLSDYDYVDVFASPASTTVLLILDKLYTLVNSVGTTEDASYKKLIIPRSTVITVGTHTFGLYYPIEIRSSLETGQITITYDTSEVNPLKSMTSNKLEYDIKIHNNRELIYLKVPCYQFETNIVENVMTPGTGLKVNVDYTNKFYAIRCFAQVLTNYGHESDVEDKWEEKELSLCVGGQTYDPGDPTVVFTPDLENNKVKLEIPYVYFTEGRIRGTLRSIIYTTEGEMNYQIPLDTTDVCSLDMFSKLTDDTIAPYVNPFKQMPALAVVPISTNIIGGSNGLTFEQLRSQVVSGSIRSNTIQTPADIDAFFAKEGYTTTLLKDGITDRVFITRATLKNASGEVVSADDTDTLFDFRADVLKDYDTIAVSGDNVFTVYPSTLYKYDNDKGVSVPLTALERKRLMGLSPAEKVAAFNNNVYTLSPFHLQVDTSSKYPTTTTYDMTDIDVKSQELITERTDEVPCQLTLIASTITLVENGPKNDYKFTFEVSKTGLDGVDPVVKSDDMMGRKNIRVLVAFRGVDDTYHFAEATYAGASESGADVFELVIPTDYKFSKENGEYSVALKIDTLHNAESKKMEYKVNLTSEVRVILCLEGEIKNVGDILGSGYRTLDTDYSTIITVDNLNNYYALSENRLICRYGSVVDEVDQRINLGYAKQEYKKHASTKFLTISTPIYATDEDGNILYSIKEENGESRIEITEKFPIGTLTAVTKTEDKAMRSLTGHNNSNYFGLVFDNESVADLISRAGYSKYTYELSMSDVDIREVMNREHLNSSAIYYLSSDRGNTGMILEPKDMSNDIINKEGIRERLEQSGITGVSEQDVNSARRYKSAYRINDIAYTSRVLPEANMYVSVMSDNTKKYLDIANPVNPMVLQELKNTDDNIDAIEVYSYTVPKNDQAAQNDGQDDQGVQEDDQHKNILSITESTVIDPNLTYLFYIGGNAGSPNYHKLVNSTWETVGDIVEFTKNESSDLVKIDTSKRVEDLDTPIVEGCTYLGKRKSDISGIDDSTASAYAQWVAIAANNADISVTKYHQVPDVAAALHASLRDGAYDTDAVAGKFKHIQVNDIHNWMKNILTFRQYASLMDGNHRNFLWHYGIKMLDNGKVASIKTIKPSGTDKPADIKTLMTSKADEFNTLLTVVADAGTITDQDGEEPYNTVVVEEPELAEGEEDSRAKPYRVLVKYNAASATDLNTVELMVHPGVGANLADDSRGKTIDTVTGNIPSGTTLLFEQCETIRDNLDGYEANQGHIKVKQLVDITDSLGADDIVDFRVRTLSDTIDDNSDIYVLNRYKQRGDVTNSNGNYIVPGTDTYTDVDCFKKISAREYLEKGETFPVYLPITKQQLSTTEGGSVRHAGAYFESASGDKYIVLDKRSQAIQLRTDDLGNYSEGHQEIVANLFTREDCYLPGTMRLASGGEGVRVLTGDEYKRSDVGQIANIADVLKNNDLYYLANKDNTDKVVVACFANTTADLPSDGDRFHNVKTVDTVIYTDFTQTDEKVYFKRKPSAPVEDPVDPVEPETPAEEPAERPIEGAKYADDYVAMDGLVLRSSGSDPDVFAYKSILNGTASSIAGSAYISNGDGIDYPLYDHGDLVTMDNDSTVSLVTVTTTTDGVSNTYVMTNGMSEDGTYTPTSWKTLTSNDRFPGLSSKDLYLVTDGTRTTTGVPELIDPEVVEDVRSNWYFTNTGAAITAFTKDQSAGTFEAGCWKIVGEGDVINARAVAVTGDDVKTGSVADVGGLITSLLLHNTEGNGLVSIGVSTVRDLMKVYNLLQEDVYCYDLDSPISTPITKDMYDIGLGDNTICFKTDDVEVNSATFVSNGAGLSLGTMTTTVYERVAPRAKNAAADRNLFHLLAYFYAGYTIHYVSCTKVELDSLQPLLPEPQIVDGVTKESNFGVTIYASSDGGEVGRAFTNQELETSGGEGNTSVMTIGAIKNLKVEGDNVALAKFAYLYKDSTPIDPSDNSATVGTGNNYSATFTRGAGDAKQTCTWFFKYGWVIVNDISESYPEILNEDGDIKEKTVYSRYINTSSKALTKESDKLDVEHKLYWEAPGTAWNGPVKDLPRYILHATETTAIDGNVFGNKTIYNAPIIPTLKVTGSSYADIVGIYEMHDALHVREDTRRNVAWDGIEADNNRSGFDSNAIFVADALMAVLQTIGLIKYEKNEDAVNGQYVSVGDPGNVSSGNVFSNDETLPPEASEGTFGFVLGIIKPDEDAYLLSERSENQSRSGLYYKTTTRWKCLIEGPAYAEFMTLVLDRINDPTKTSYGYVYCVGDRNALTTNGSPLIKCINFLTTKEMEDGSTIPDMVPNEEIADPNAGIARNEDWNTRVGKWPWDVKDWRIVRKDRKRDDTNYVTFEYDTLFEISLDTSRMAKYCEYMSGSYDLDENGQLQVVEGGDRYIQYVISMIHIDAKLAQTTINQTNKTYPDSITGVMRTHFDNLASIKNEMFTNSRLYFAPVKSIGRATFSVGNNKTEELPLDVEVSFRLHVSRATATDDQLLLSIKNNIVEIIDTKILKGYLNCPEVASEIMATIGNVVNYVDVLGINGDTNLQTMKCVDTVGVPHLKHRLVLMDDDQTIDIERAVNLDIVIND